MQAQLYGFGSWSYVYDGERVVLETNDSGTVQAKYTTAGGSYFGPLLHMMRGGNTSRFPVFDAVGAVRSLVDTSGTITDSYTADAFGKQLSSTGSTVNPYRYGGEWGYVTEASGLQQLGARFYFPEVGRFIQQDPLRFRRNRYAYARSNPVSYTDASGLFEIFAVAEGEAAAVVGVDLSMLLTVDFSHGWESGLYKSQGPAFGLTAGVAYGGGFALRDVEGYSTNFDANVGDWSGTASWDDRGFNSLAATVGPGIGAAFSVTQTSPILTAGQVRDDLQSLWQDAKDIWRWLRDPCL